MAGLKTTKIFYLIDLKTSESSANMVQLSLTHNVYTQHVTHNSDLY